MDRLEFTLGAACHTHRSVAVPRLVLRHIQGCSADAHAGTFARGKFWGGGPKLWRISSIEGTQILNHVKHPFDLYPFPSNSYVNIVRSSNYLNALIQVAPFACTLVDSDEVSIPAHEQLCNLRRQCTKQADEDKLYNRKNENWISWIGNCCESNPAIRDTTPRLAYTPSMHATRETLVSFLAVADVQKCRQKCIQAYNAATVEEKRKLIKKVLIIMCALLPAHICQYWISPSVFL